MAWYRKHLEIPAAEQGRRIYLEIDGAMSYSAVWCKGKFVGGWPYGYSSYRVDLTPYLKTGGDNVPAIRLGNPEGAALASSTAAALTIAPGATASHEAKLDLAKPKLWDIGSPERYTAAAAKLLVKPDRATITTDGRDLSFVTVTVADKDGLMVPRSHPKLKFEISGPGEIVSTDNGDPTDLTSFQSTERAAFNGLALAIVRAKPGTTAPITVRVTSEGLAPAEVTLNAPRP